MSYAEGLLQGYALGEKLGGALNRGIDQYQLKKLGNADQYTRTEEFNAAVPPDQIEQMPKSYDPNVQRPQGLMMPSGQTPYQNGMAGTGMPSAVDSMGGLPPMPRQGVNTPQQPERVKRELPDFFAKAKAIEAQSKYFLDQGRADEAAAYMKFAEVEKAQIIKKGASAALMAFDRGDLGGAFSIYNNMFPDGQRIVGAGKGPQPGTLMLQMLDEQTGEVREAPASLEQMRQQLAAANQDPWAVYQFTQQQRADAAKAARDEARLGIDQQKADAMTTAALFRGAAGNAGTGTAGAGGGGAMGRAAGPKDITLKEAGDDPSVWGKANEVPRIQNGGELTNGNRVMAAMATNGQWTVEPGTGKIGLQVKLPDGRPVMQRYADKMTGNQIMQQIRDGATDPDEAELGVSRYKQAVMTHMLEGKSVAEFSAALAAMPADKRRAAVTAIRQQYGDWAVTDIKKAKPQDDRPAIKKVVEGFTAPDIRAGVRQLGRGAQPKQMEPSAWGGIGGGSMVQQLPYPK